MSTAAQFVAERYPEMDLAAVEPVEFGQGWLVQVTLGRAGEPVPTRLLLMVHRQGTVEELGAAGAARQRSTTVLDSLRRVNEVIDLR